MVPAGHVLNASLVDKLPYDTLGDFAPVSLLADFSFILVTPPALPAANVRQLVEMAKAKPGALNYGAAAGSLGHLGGEMLRRSGQVNITYIPYKGVPQIAAAIQNNEVQVFFDTTGTALPQIKAGRYKALAVTGARRSAALPEVPTMAEAGMADFELTGWNGLLVRSGTPPEIIRRLNAETVQILKQPDMRERLLASNIEPVGSTPEEFGAVLKSNMANWSRLLKDAGISAK
jgi:tripartite-type tricarboxylate transporter receptor subunit TctC